MNSVTGEGGAKITGEVWKFVDVYDDPGVKIVGLSTLRTGNCA
jgi:hypothetical protein